MNYRRSCNLVELIIHRVKVAKVQVGADRDVDVIIIMAIPVSVKIKALMALPIMPYRIIPIIYIYRE